MRGDPGSAADEIVESVVNEQRIQGIARESFRDFDRVDGTVVAGMAGPARAAVPTEGLVIEEALTLAYPGGRSLRGPRVRAYGF